jgi:uncharacterized protein (TIGR03437 family)
MKPLVVGLLCLAATAHAAGTVFSTVLAGSGQEFANAVTSDSQGNTYVAGLTYSSDFPVTAGAYQTTFGGTCDAFVAKIGPTGTVVWATFLGGQLSDSATGVAVDSNGNVWVSGWTVSPNFPLANAIQTANLGGYAGFAAKFDPTGAKLLYSTLLGGQAQAEAAGIALDSTGNAYVAVNTNSAASFPGISNGANASGVAVTKLSPQGALIYTYFRPNGEASAIAVDSTAAAYIAGANSAGSPGNALQAYGAPATQLAIVFKISADGSTKVYDRTFGGSTQAAALAIAVDSAGEAWVAGTTASADFPLVHPLANQTTVGARPLWSSTNAGATWSPLDGLPFALPEMMLVDPSTPATLYEGTADLGVFKSTNSGATWTQANAGMAGTNIQALAIDPIHPQTLYAATATTVYKSTNGAGNWTAIDSPTFTVTAILVDAQNSNNIYTANTTTSGTAGLRKSSDGGNTWVNLTFPSTVASIALDPNASGHIVAISNEIVLFGGLSGTFTPPYLYRSNDGGNTWQQLQAVGQPTAPIIADGSTNPTTFYDSLALRSLDGGATWSGFPSLPGGNSTAPIAVDPSGTLYATVSGTIYVSRDHGGTWAPTGTTGPTGFNLVTAGSAGALYTEVNEVGTAGFLSKFSADGSTLSYSTYLRGHASLEVPVFYASEPNVFLSENWVGGIALDPAGNVVVTGGTRASDFPTVNAAQAANAGLADAFAASISANGSTLNYATYFGGSKDDGALAAAVDSAGNVILAGQTFSGDFPTASRQQLPFSYGNAFVVKLASGPPAITAVLNGASFQPGIEAGSWVMIAGTNLANVTRTWTAADFTGNSLPVQLSGVSVTIDGKPAYPYYISPTQINVQAPSDSTLGAVSVVVNNNGSLSAPAAATLQNYAPAFFVNLPGSSAITTNLNYAPVGTASAPAAPGSTVVLWGTGFGPTTPMTAAGLAVSGAPATTNLPTVSVGGMQVQVLNAGLTTGSAGLYQIAIQLPANVPTGTVPIQASIGGVQSPTGVTIVVGN